MKALLSISRVIDTANIKLGKALSWLIVAAVLISATNAIIRKLFDMSSNSWLELQWVLFGFVFLLCSPWTLLSNEHIRIDIVNSHLKKSTRNWIDVFGHIFWLLPFCVVMMVTSYPFAIHATVINEQSMNAGGLPTWPAKWLLPICFTLLLIQGISELIKRLAIIQGKLEDTASGGGHHASAEAEAQRLLDAARADTAETN